MKFKVLRTNGTDNYDRKYLVVNIDEPYAGQVADLIEAEERRKGTWEYGEKNMREVMGIGNMDNKKVFRLNEDGVAEWIVAGNKQQAFDFADKLWGGIGRDEHFKEYLADNPEATFEQFLDYFVQEELMNHEFAFRHDDGSVEKKTFREFLDNITEVPSYFACQDY